MNIQPESAFEDRFIKMKDGRTITLLDFFREMARKESADIFKSYVTSKNNIHEKFEVKNG